MHDAWSRACGVRRLGRRLAVGGPTGGAAGQPGLAAAALGQGDLDQQLVALVAPPLVFELAPRGLEDPADDNHVAAPDLADQADDVPVDPVQRRARRFEIAAGELPVGLAKPGAKVRDIGANGGGEVIGAFDRGQV